VGLVIDGLTWPFGGQIGKIFFRPRFERREDSFCSIGETDEDVVFLDCRYFRVICTSPLSSTLPRSSYWQYRNAIYMKEEILLNIAKAEVKI